jgi:hypothetical protein
MTEPETPKRSRSARKPAEADSRELGYRAGRRRSKVAKKTKSAAKVDRAKDSVRQGARTVRRWLMVGGLGAVALVVAALVMLLLITGVNSLARWYAKRNADEAARIAATEKLKENVLFIGVQGKQATGFLALRVDRKGGRVFGLAIPDGAFVEVPGQGFEKIGDSYKAGPRISMAAVANYLSVPFERYAVVSAETYSSALKKQSVGGLMANVSDTNLDPAERAELAKALAGVSSKNVGIAPLPVRPVSVGALLYYEPQRDQIADLLYSWWGVRFGQGKQPFRVILYNGAGAPGIAGVAAEQLIKAGFRVVDTGNADRFDYKTTQIVVYRGTDEDVRKLREVLGTGDVARKSPDQNITDAIIIIGKDFGTSGKGGKK